MKQPLITVSALALALAACAAQTPPPAPPPTQPRDSSTPLTPQQRDRQQAIEDARAAGIIGPRSQPTSVGGFMLQDVNSSDVREESQNAIALLRTKQNDPSISLRTIRSFGFQIVSGMNYRLELDVATAAGPRAITVVMYEHGDPSNVQREITSVNGL